MYNTTNLIYSDTQKMYDQKIQTPISSAVLIAARKKAREMGFSSINDVIRILMKQFADGNLEFGFRAGAGSQSIPSAGLEEQRELAGILAEIGEQGQAKVAKRVVLGA